MRIGELLRERGWVDPIGLDRAIAEQHHTNKRLVSLLVARGLIDPDIAARALGAQHNVSAALQRHLENRDKKLARFIPPELARSLCALPIGRGRAGELIVCVRDPRPATQTALVQVTRSKVLLAIAPASDLERLVDQTYGPIEPDEFDVDMSTGPIDVPEDFVKRPARAASVPGDLDLDDDDAGGLDLGAMMLVGLDDARVAKDPNQSGQFALPRSTTPVAPIAPQPIAPPPPLPDALAAGTLLPRARVEPVVSLDDTLVLLERSATRDASTDVAMMFVRGRWSSSVLFMIKEGAALGHRGHGGTLSDDAVQALTIPLATTSIVRSAHDARRLVTELPSKGGAIQDRLMKLLGNPRSPAAAPIAVGPRVACVLVVGDARDRANATGDMTLDLDDLTVALGSAYARIVRDAKR